MSARREDTRPSIPLGLIAIMVFVLAGGAWGVKAFLMDDSPRRKSPVTTVTLLRPPPPVQAKEKPPEPVIKEVPKKEEIITPGPKDQPENSSDNTPAGDKLGLDAEGGAGSDAFGLVGKKGGRSLLAGGDGLGKYSLLSKFGWYNQIVEREITRKVMRSLEENGGVQKGKLKTVLRVSLDGRGAVTNYRIIGSSGNHKMDEAVLQAVEGIRISEPPPEGMPRTMVLRISSQG